VFTSHKPARNSIDNGIQDPRLQFDIYKRIVFDYASICGKKLNKDWRRYNELLTVQVAVCNSHCWYCYVPDELKSGSKDYSKYISIKEIVDTFLNIRKRNGDKYNILRISGGEPFLVPELILDTLEEIEDRSLSDNIIVWSETNLSPFVKDEESCTPLVQLWLEKSGRNIRSFSNYRNFVLHPCLHATSPEELEEVCLIEGKYYNELLNAFKVLVDNKFDIYPTISPNTCSPKGIKEIFHKLKSFNEKLPLTVALIEYHLDYEPIDLRLSRSGRKGYLYGKRTLIEKWEKLLRDSYNVGYAQIPRCEVKLY
jgi:uncharacterized Fe-S cluster-containing radical SAM superfamily protein